MRKFNFKFNKIASAMITNTEFLELVASEKKTTLISTGMCNLSDIKKAVGIFKKKNCAFILMHCVSTYPCPENNLNLLMIQKLIRIFKCKVGYSGHESTVSPTILAWHLGASVIERHITLDRAMWGTDQSASLAEEGIKNLTSIIYKTPFMLGDGIKKFSRIEKNIAKKFRYWL
jgi:N-acetylneuraminate synthase